VNSVGPVSIVAVVSIAVVIVSDAVASVAGAANIVDNLLWPMSLLLFELTV
jgi:hypothetical protein